ncbi:cyclase family protein [Pusillimonas sp. TS35]|uniref:cyclase family protein n=1 Tax=Paracandidimonas lactea TaxID=2895524 RepID=UPI001370AF69|nr:cyclase family protein [Paracandidimonas lactea]MYN13928.1 cyclase family protein [Pusillimonas sp. TS35]
MLERWKVRPENSNWGDFGPDDEIGRLNLITPDKRVKAAREIRTGEAFCLSLPLDLPGGTDLNPNRKPPVRHVAIRKQGLPSVNYPLHLEDARYVDCSCDDSVTLFTQYSTQWDALAHVGQHFDGMGNGNAQPTYYNGFRGGLDILGPDDRQGPVALRLGIEKMAETGVQGRGVLLDLHAHFGDARTLVGMDLLKQVIDKDGVVIEEGDMLCLHTGFAQKLVDMQGKPDPYVLHHSCAVLDGRDEALKQWIADSGISVLIADNFAVEAYPYDHGDCVSCEGLPLHQACLFRLGINLGELWYLTPLARWLRQSKRHHFMLTCPPLRLPGSFGSPVTPVATV